MRRLLLASLASCLALTGCGDDADPVAGAVRGAELAASPALSSSGFNELACTSCHAVTADDPRILSGYDLRGAAARPSWWGGQVIDFREAVEFCLVWFMKGDPLDVESDDARALYDYLVELGSEGPAEALPLTIVAKIDTAPPRGDAGRGAEVHRLACADCHGDASTGTGRLDAAPILPDQAREEALVIFPEFEPAVVFTEKVRHGQFFGIGGTMPLYSLEALSDEDLGALLAFYGL